MIYIIIFIVLIYILIDKYLKYQDKQPIIRQQNEYAEINRKIAAGIPPGIEKIVAMDFMENSDKVAIAKIDGDYKLFFEVTDTRYNSTETIHLNEPIFIKPSSVYLYNDDQYNLPMIFHSNLDDKNLSSIIKFKFLLNKSFYLNIINTKKYESQSHHWNIIIDFEGKIIRKATDNFHKNYDYSQDTKLEFFNVSKFNEINLTKFFDDFFDKDNFHHNRIMGAPYSTFFSSDNKKLGLCFFLIDEEIPRGNYSIFDITNFEIPKLLFSYKIDEYGNDFKFNNDNKKIIYWYYENNDGTLISFIIRDLDEKKFKMGKKVIIEFSNDFYMQDYELVNSTLIIIGLGKLQLYNLETNEKNIIQRNMYSPYCFNENSLLYLNNYKLEIIDISKVNEMLNY